VPIRLLSARLFHKSGVVYRPNRTERWLKTYLRIYRVYIYPFVCAWPTIAVGGGSRSGPQFMLIAIDSGQVNSSQSTVRFPLTFSAQGCRMWTAGCQIRISDSHSDCDSDFRCQMLRRPFADGFDAANPLLATTSN